ncbi:hypothetical protein [Rickettsiella endosymbiont of Rhagonycha lignosa]|uniref:hypothetical protein n=1 Tax=Rickettsiella endosymbiont of Rhagonycha lignosa TaxID=3077937 RepID=UPI00313DF083
MKIKGFISEHSILKVKLHQLIYSRANLKQARLDIQKYAIAPVELREIISL